MRDYYEIEVENGLIKVIGTKFITKEAVEAFCKEVPKLATSLGISRVLIDSRGINQTLTTMERYKYALEIVKHFIGLKVASVEFYSLRDPQNFGETVAVNRGANFKVFEEIEDAYNWFDVQDNLKVV